MPKVRLIGADGEQVGIVDTDDARQMARDADLDLVEVAAGAKPPVARLLDYSKYRYEQDQKAKAARKHQTQVNVREIKLRPKIADNDYNTKKGHVTRFLKGGDKVKVTIMFRGREQAHPDRGRDLLERLFEDLDGLAVIESKPLQEGRNMSMLLGPSKEATREASKAGQKAEAEEKPKAESKPKAKADAEPGAEASAKTKPKPEAKPEAETTTAKKPKTIADAEPETDAKAEAKPKAETKPKAKAQT